MPFTPILPTQAKYIVLTTGYISRLRNKLDEIDRILDEDACCEDTVILGLTEGISFYGKEDNLEELKNLMGELNKDHEITDGSIVLKTEDKRINIGLMVDCLSRDLDYCEFFAMSSISEMGIFETDMGKTLWIEFDTESG